MNLPSASILWVATLASSKHAPETFLSLCREAAESIGEGVTLRDVGEKGTACELRWQGQVSDSQMEILNRWGERHQLDVIVQPLEGRTKKLLLSDMDSTVIEQECIDEMADMLGIKPEIAAITERSMRGEIPFEAALTERVALLKGLPEAALEEVFSTRISFAPGAKEMIAAFKKSGGTAVLVSGGFTFFTSRVAAALGFDAHYANVLEVADGKLTGTVTLPILGADAKKETLEQYCQKLGLTLADAITLGDGANDLPMLEAAGMGVACHAKPRVIEAMRAQGKAVIRYSDLTTVAYLLGLV